MGIRERLICDFSTGRQTQSEIEETGYDRTRAAAYSMDLGLAIKRLRAAGDPGKGHWNDVILHVNKSVYGHFATKHVALCDRGTLCRIAVCEWYYPQCTLCRGAGQAWEVVYDEHGLPQRGALLSSCEECHGSGMRRYNDRERAAVLKRALNMEETAVVTAALNSLVFHERVTDRNAQRALTTDIPERREYMAAA